MGIQLLALLFIAALAFWFGRESVFRSHEYTSTMALIEHYKNTYLRRQGVTNFAGGRTYDLRSFDGGTAWYDVTRTVEGGLIINGPADPALLSHLKGMDNLIAHAKANGPVQLSNPHPGEVDLLESAGFTVSETSK